MYLAILANFFDLALIIVGISFFGIRNKVMQSLEFNLF